jgi:RNA polymerase sigma-70 factor (ECF subfamily)
MKAILKEKERLFEQMIQMHRGILYKVVNTYCNNGEDRKDLLQEIMLQLWRAFDNYNPQYKISTWFYRIALNVAISDYRKNSVKRDSLVSLDDSNDQISDSAATDAEFHFMLLDRFINELKELDKALMLLYLEERSHQEIADIMGISTTNVSTKIARIKNKLKQQFSKHNNY